MLKLTEQILNNEKEGKGNDKFHDKFNLVIIQRSIRQIILDIERYERKMKDVERLAANPANFIDKSEITLLWMEVVTRKDLLKALTLVPYEQMLELRAEDKRELRQFFLDLNGFSWRENFGWIGQTATVARLSIEPFSASTSLYQGVKMSKSSQQSAVENINEGFIRELILPGNGLDGNISVSLKNLLKKCSFLNLNWNTISANISIFNFRQYTSLIALQLSGNDLIGTLDESSFYYLSSLKILDLSFNNLSGSLAPNLFENLTSLEKLNLSYNNFTGPLPTSMRKLIRLQELKLYHNEFSGEVTEELVSPMTELALVNLSSNRFTKALQAFCKNSQVEVLQLQENCLEERVHSNIQDMKKLEVLYLQDNKLYGILPAELCELKRLRLLNLSNNNLRGCLPENIGRLSNLESLLIAGNNIVGPVPLSFGELQKLRDLTLFKSYPSELCTPKRAFDRFAFNRIYLEGPKHGINSIHWDYKDVYGRERTAADDESVTIFSGKY